MEKEYVYVKISANSMRLIYETYLERIFELIMILV